MHKSLWLVVLGVCMLAVPATGAELEILIIYDNTSARAGIEADWGFAALVTFRGQRVLFDTGTKPGLFLENLEKLKIDPGSFSHVVISHPHGDHLNGLYELFPLNRSMEVFFLDSFPDEVFRKAETVGIKPQRVKGPVEIVPGVYTTGIVDGASSEQALVVETSKGLVVVTGCSHPGVVRMVEAAEEQRGKNSVRLVLGGFHLSSQSESDINAQIKRMRELNVASVVPTHCTGELAWKLFREAYGEHCDSGGAGKTFELE